MDTQNRQVGIEEVAVMYFEQALQAHRLRQMVVGLEQERAAAQNAQNAKKAQNAQKAQKAQKESAPKTEDS